MFTHIFSYDIHLSVGQTQIQEARAAKINRLLWIVLQIILHSDTLCRTPSLLVALVNSFIVSVEQEWFTLKCMSHPKCASYPELSYLSNSGWQSLIQIFSRIQRTILTAVVDEVQVVEKMILGRRRPTQLSYRVKLIFPTISSANIAKRNGDHHSNFFHEKTNRYSRRCDF